MCFFSSLVSFSFISSLIKTESHEGQRLLQFGWLFFFGFCSFVEDLFESAIICGYFFLWLMIKSQRAPLKTGEWWNGTIFWIANDQNAEQMPYKQIDISSNDVKWRRKKKKPHWHDRIAPLIDGEKETICAVRGLWKCEQSPIKPMNKSISITDDTSWLFPWHVYLYHLLANANRRPVMLMSIPWAPIVGKKGREISTDYLRWAHVFEIMCLLKFISMCDDAGRFRVK